MATGAASRFKTSRLTFALHNKAIVVCAFGPKPYKAPCLILMLDLEILCQRTSLAPATRRTADYALSMVWSRAARPDARTRDIPTNTMSASSVPETVRCGTASVAIVLAQQGARHLSPSAEGSPPGPTIFLF